MTKLQNFLTKHFGGSNLDLKWFFRINPESPNSVPLASEYRKTAPGSQPEYSLESTKQLSKSRYFDRDVRRDYPKTIYFDQKDFEVLKKEELKVPVIMNRYKYSKADTDHDPTGSEANPHFSIRQVQ